MGGPTSVTINVPTPTGTAYPVSGSGVIGGIKNLLGITAKGEAQTKVVQDKAGGDYRLLRQGQQGSVRLGAMAQTAARRRAGGTDAAPKEASGKAGKSAKGGGTQAASGQKGGGATTPESTVKAFSDGAKAMCDAIEAEADEVARLGQDAANAGLSRSDARNLALQHGVRRSALEREITGKLDDLRKVEAAIAHLPKEQQDAARKEVDATFQFLATKLIGVRLPGAAQMLERLDPADAAASTKALGDVTGLDADQLRQRYADGSVKAEGGGRTATSSLVDKPAAFAGELLGAMRKLHEHGLLRPELMQRLADQPQVRDWGSAVSEMTRTPTKARQQLDALFVLRGQLDAVTHGNGKSIDFILGRDSRLDEYRLDLKKAFGVEVSRHVIGADGHTRLQTSKLSEAGIEAQHGLSKAWYGLRQALEPHRKELEKLAPGLGLNAFLNPSGESEIRLDSRTLDALHKAARAMGKEPKLEQVARSVNLLVAHMMLLQRKLDAELAPARLDDLRGERDTAKLAFAQRAMAVLGQEPLSSLHAFDADTWRQLGRDLAGDDPDARDVAAERIAAHLRLGSRDALASLSRLNQNLNDAVSLQLAVDNAEGDPDEQARLMDRVRTLATERGQLLARLTNELGQEPTGDELDTLLGLAGLASHYESLRAEHETQTQAAQDDHQLGLTRQDLQKAGFTGAEIDDMSGPDGLFDTDEHRGTIGALAGMGLQSTADVGKVNASVNKIIDRVLQRGMAQDTVGQLGKTNADGRANLVLDMFLQDVTGRPGDFRVTMADARDRVADGVSAFTKDVAPGDALDVLDRFAQSVERHEQLTLQIGTAATRLSELDGQRNRAETELARLAGQVNVKIDAHEPKGFELAKKLQQAVFLDRELGRHEANPAVPREHLAPLREELDRLLRDLRHLDPATMSHTMFSRGPQTREQLRAFATDTRLAIAEQIVTIRSTPTQKKAETEKIKAAQIEADRILAGRKELLGASHTMLVRAIRAAVVDARRNSGEPVGEFDPLAHRAKIEAQLADWGIRADDFRPEIDDVLHGTFDADTVERWVKEGKQSVSDPTLQADLQPSFATKAKRFFGRVLTDSQKIDHAARLAMVDTVKSLAPGERMFVAQGVGGKFTTGKVPLETTGTVKARLDAFGRERKMLEVQRSPHGWELFFKAGSEGGAKAGLSAEIFKIAEVTVSGGFTASNLEGAGLVFAKESDLVAFLDKLLTQDSVTPKDWIKAKEAVLVDDSSFGLAGGVDAMVSTKSVSQFLESIGEPVKGLMVDETFLGSGDVEVFVGATAKAEAGKEWRRVGERNAERVSLESETVSERSVTVAAGIYLGLPTVHEFLIDKYALEDTGALDRMDSFFKTQNWGIPKSEDSAGQAEQGADDAHSATKDEHMWNPMSLDYNNPLSISKDLYKRKLTEVEKVSFSRDGMLEAEGNERVKTLSVGRKLTGTDLADLGPTLTKAETARGAVDELAAALRANKPVGDSGRGFATAAMALLAEADVGDELAVTYALKEDVRTVANEHIRRGQELRTQAESARKAGRGDEAAELESRARAEAAFVKQLQNEDSNYEPSRIQLVKSTSVDKDLTVFTLGLVSMQRYNQGGISRPAMTVDVPGGPAERAAARHAAHTAPGGHGPQASGSHGATSQGPTHTPATGAAPTGGLPPQQGASPPVTPPLTREELRQRTQPFTLRAAQLDAQVTALQRGGPRPPEKMAELRATAATLARELGAAVAGLPTKQDKDAVDWLQHLVSDLRLAIEFEDRLAAVSPDLAIDRSKLRTGDPVPTGESFYREAQAHQLCSVHAINAALGGPVVGFAQLDRFKAVLYGEMDPGGYRPEEVFSSRGGAFADEPFKFLQTLKRLDQIPHEVGYHVIDPTGAVGGSLTAAPEITGDAAIVYTQNPAHFVAFRKDAAGEWRRLDSLDESALLAAQRDKDDVLAGQLATQPRQSPQDYIAAALAKGNRYVTLTTLQRPEG